MTRGSRLFLLALALLAGQLQADAAQPLCKTWVARIQSELGLFDGWAQAAGAMGKDVYGLAQFDVSDPIQSIAFRWDGDTAESIPGTAGFMPWGVSTAGNMAGYRLVPGVPGGSYLWDTHAAIFSKHGELLFDAEGGEVQSGFLAFSGNGEYAAGFKETVPHTSYAPYLWERSKGTRLLETLPGSNAAIAYAVNSKGTSVGWSYSADGYLIGVKWDRRGKLTPLSLSGVEDPNLEITPIGINDSGDIVGSYQDRSTSEYRGFILRASGVTTVTDPNVLLSGINDHGDAVGYIQGCAPEGCPVLLKESGELVSLPVPSGFLDMRAMKITDQGTILGTTFTNATSPIVFPQHVVRWSEERSN